MFENSKVTKTKRTVFEKVGNQTRKFTEQEKSKIHFIENFLDVDFTQADFTIECIYAICKKLEKVV